MYYIERPDGKKFVGFVGGVSVWGNTNTYKWYMTYSMVECDVAKLSGMGYLCRIRSSEIEREAV